ncbi:hypothetical protein GY45DRAFT_172678 [Cubamyces sp. BRFM 1775]|nr:hypothetical protein GY45DRAFT_172678 [Cubamyces sp. BRFM 1775]
MRASSLPDASLAIAPASTSPAAEQSTTLRGLPCSPTGGGRCRDSRHARHRRRRRSGTLAWSPDPGVSSLDMAGRVPDATWAVIALSSAACFPTLSAGVEVKIKPSRRPTPERG